MNTQDIIIIGAGNVGTHLANMFAKKETKVSICTRSTSITNIDKKVAIIDYNNIPNSASLYLICVKDEAIENVANNINKTDAIVAHTSGSICIDSINKFKNRAIFYPFQTFRKEIPLFENDFPILIEASDKKTTEEIKKYAHMLSSKVLETSYDGRAYLHTAGVFVSNFVNLLYDTGFELIKDNFDPKDVLLPIVKETALRIALRNPSELQTGPAIRNDRKTISKHLNLIDSNDDLKSIYTTLTNILLKKYNYEKLS